MPSDLYRRKGLWALLKRNRKLPVAAFVASAVWMGVPAVSLANENGPTLPNSSGDALDTAGMIFQVIVILALVIGLFYIAIRILAKRNRMIGANRSLRSLGGVPLGPNKSIQIVEIGHCLYIVGVGESIGLLEKIDDPDEVAYLTELLEQRTSMPQFASLTDWMQRKLGKQNDAKQETDAEATQSFQQVFYDKMQYSMNRKKRFEDILHEKHTDRLNDE